MNAGYGPDNGGTSISAAIVSGVAGLVWSLDQTLTPAEVLDILKQSADDKGATGWDPTYGAGRVNAFKALQLAGGSTPPPPDTTPPTISSVSATNLGSNSATINWSTNEFSDSQVEYGPTLSYGNSTPLNSTMVQSHIVNLTNLSPSTLYNYRVKSKDANNNLGVSGNFTFTTQALPDTQAPSVPANLSASAVSTSQINLAWTASTDNVGVAGYRVHRNGTQIATTANNNYNDNNNLSAGTAYTYTVQAYDQAGNASAQSTSVVATTQSAPVSHLSLSPTSLSFSAVSGGATPSGKSTTLSNSGTASATWTATPSQNWCHVLPNTGSLANGSNLPLSVLVDAPSNVGSFTCTISFSAPNSDNNPQNLSITYTVTSPPTQDTTPPTVSITAPANGAKVSGNITISATASDNIGVTKVEFYIDGTLRATDTSSPYSTRWNVNKSVPVGAHTIQAKAYDAAGNTATASINVTK
jgi:chitodextrinase